MIIKRYFQKRPTAIIQNQLELEESEPMDVFEDRELIQKMNSILADYSSIIDQDKEENLLEDHIKNHLTSVVRSKKRQTIGINLYIQQLFTRPSYAIISFGLVVIVAITFYNLNKTDEIINSSSKNKAQIINRIATKAPDYNSKTSLSNSKFFTENKQFQSVSSADEITNYLLSVKDPAYLCSDLIINEADTFIKYTTIPEDGYN
jgi:hypothetical protein